jgi:hypothetical protein
VLRTITESEGNEDQLRDDTISAVSHIVLRHPRWPALGLAFIESFDSINLGDIRRTAKQVGILPLRCAIGTMIFTRLQELLGPPVIPKQKRPQAPPKVEYAYARVPEVQRRVALGSELLALKATAGWRQFGRQAHAQFGIEPLAIASLTSVARLYANRPEITSRLSWNALTELSSRSLPASIRQDIEARILAGYRVVATDITKARQAHRRTIKGRWRDKPQAESQRPAA